MRWTTAAALSGSVLGIGILISPPAAAEETECNYPSCTAPHHAQCRAALELRQRDLRRVWLDVLGASGVLRLAQAIRPSMVPLTRNARSQARKQPVPRLLGRRRAGAGRFLPDLCGQGGHH